MLYIVSFIFFLSIFFLLYGIFSIMNGNKIEIEKRIGQIQELNTINEEKIHNKSFS